MIASAVSHSAGWLIQYGEGRGRGEKGKRIFFSNKGKRIENEK
jgi:hypothetical protein